LKAVSNSTFGFTSFGDCPAREIGRGFFCKRFSKDQARRIAANVAKLPGGEMAMPAPVSVSATAIPSSWIPFAEPPS
jgi:hypothetical protein